MDKKKLLTKRNDTASGMPEANVELDGIGTVRVRGLSRAESLHMRELETPGAGERWMLHKGMVDPALTEQEAGQWQEVSPTGEIRPVSDKIVELSGLGDRPDKAAYKSDGGEPGD